MRESTGDNKTDAVVRILENVGTKVFFGLCIYVLLDTRRQVSVAVAQGAAKAACSCP